MVRRTLGTALGKSVAGAVKLRGKSNGQAMPGLVVEKFIPGYLSEMLKQLPHGVVIITGTNGKTTTTKMVVEMLQAAGKRVLTNPTGSNLTRGIISSVSNQATKTGKLPFDLAVFELDEAYARTFTDVVTPRFVLALNASRDQLDRFGEVDMVAKLVGQTMLCASEMMIVNADDKRLSAMARDSGRPVLYFGVSPELLCFFPRDDELVAVGTKTTTYKPADVPLGVELLSFEGSHAVYRFGKERVEAELQVTGQHNFQNAAGALALARVILPQADTTQLLASLSQVRPAFGRGQAYKLKDGSELQLNLVKNPASFRQGLASYVRPDTSVMIAINDNVADSRDMSWLWDINFSNLHKITPVRGPSSSGGGDVAVASGSRAVDMALRLSYDEIPVKVIEPDIEAALKQFCALPGDKVVFASYTCMLKLHSLLERKAGKEL